MISVTKFQQQLITEKNKLEAALGDIAVKSKTAPGDWDTIPADSTPTTMREEVADRLEDNEEREAAERELEGRLREITAALDRIADGTYGQCRVCQMEIENDRLEANPAATTCKAHLNN